MPIFSSFQQSSPRKKQLGLILVILSFAFYGALMLVPFLPFSAGGKLQLSAGLVILGEASFWIAVLILGKEAVSRFSTSIYAIGGTLLCGKKRRDAKDENK